MADELLLKAQRIAQRFHESGTVSQTTMREINKIVDEAIQEEKLKAFAESSAQRIRALREKEKISQGVLARLINMSANSIQKWERDETKPTGAALILLMLIEEKGLQVIC
ncbi:helix-turn-helix domain-containing protein [Rahnella laticis]|uniref:helix-turn-helix domain-containing protein n=1 Tax=Rahnella laticis TaxID=2787622 RepID=UPI0018A31CA8|nr:helix-turn-helix domain-containing protein [Rahnella laticis]MBF7994248.1 helix-turn-helix domain-containing protein [Rahnella laticis]